MRIVYLGTPQFAVPPLEALHRAGFDIVAVITQPDRAQNRKGRVLPTAVKQLAQDLGIKVHAFESIKSPQSIQTLKSLKADLFITAAYGQILSREVLSIPVHGTFNIHGSLLPKYRGAAPVQWALINGESVTGVTIMRTELGVDTGDIILQRQYTIEPNDTSLQVLEKLSHIGAEAIVDAVKLLKNGDITYTPQDHDLATYSPMLRKVDGEIDFTKSAEEIKNRVRALCHNPGCYTWCDDCLIKIFAVTVVENHSTNSQAGKIIQCDCKSGLTVLCGTGTLRIDELQASGCRRMSCADFLRGRRMVPGSYLTAEHC